LVTESIALNSTRGSRIAAQSPSASQQPSSFLSWSSPLLVSVQLATAVTAVVNTSTLIIARSSQLHSLHASIPTAVTPAVNLPNAPTSHSQAPRSSHSHFRHHCSPSLSPPASTSLRFSCPSRFSFLCSDVLTHVYWQQGAAGGTCSAGSGRIALRQRGACASS
jgi:hypothetical protein